MVRDKSDGGGFVLIHSKIIIKNKGVMGGYNYRFEREKMVIKELVASRKQEKEEATPDPVISLLFPSSLCNCTKI